MTYTALPCGRVAIAHLEGAVDTATATTYAGWLQDASLRAESPRLRESLRKSASEPRAVIRQAISFKHQRAQ